MNILEILSRKRFLDSKLVLIDQYLESLGKTTSESKSDLYTAAINKKFDLLSKIRSHKILIDNLNRDTIITIDGTELSVYEALYVIQTLVEKMDTFKSVILGDDSKSLAVFTLLDKLDVLYDEYMNIRLAISSSDISTDWEK